MFPGRLAFLYSEWKFSCDKNLISRESKSRKYSSEYRRIDLIAPYLACISISQSKDSVTTLKVAYDLFGDAGITVDEHQIHVSSLGNVLWAVYVARMSGIEIQI